jgi:hypothetical protein
MNSRSFEAASVQRTFIRPSGTTLFLVDQLFHSSSDLFFVEQGSAINLGQALFDFAEKPFVVIDEARDRFVDQDSASRPCWAAIRSNLAYNSAVIFTSIDPV